MRSASSSSSGSSSSSSEQIRGRKRRREDEAGDKARQSEAAESDGNGAVQKDSRYGLLHSSVSVPVDPLELGPSAAALAKVRQAEEEKRAEVERLKSRRRGDRPRKSAEELERLRCDMEKDAATYMTSLSAEQQDAAQKGAPSQSAHAPPASRDASFLKNMRATVYDGETPSLGDRLSQHKHSRQKGSSADKFLER